MATFEVDISDGMADVLRELLPPGWTVEDWLALKSEQAIAQARLNTVKNRIHADAADAPLTPSQSEAMPGTLTNEDVQQARQQPADSDD